MESLALAASIILLVALLSGPLSIGLSTNRLRRSLKAKPSLIKTLVNTLRIVVHIVFVALGVLIGGFLLTSDLPLAPRIIGLASVVTSYIGLRREYFPEFLPFQEVMNRLGLHKKNGRSSGQDGNGPAGQH